jgi:hypothetical protein
MTCWYPSAKTAGWDFSGFTDFNTPNINFYFRRSDTATQIQVYLQSWTGGALDGSYYTDFTSDIAAATTWYHESYPVGPFYNVQDQFKGFTWTEDAAPNWAHIDAVLFHAHMGQNKYFNVDGLHFGDAAVCRTAWNSTSVTANKVRMKTITDNIGKDDSLKVTDDSGLMAQMAYAELLKLQTTPTVGEFTTLMIKDVLPGSLLHVHADKKFNLAFNVDMDMRITKLVDIWDPKEVTTTSTVTSDVTNSTTRTRYGDWNKMAEMIRPDMQDRQASSIKGGDIDIRLARLIKDYP